LDSAYGRPWKL
jgi:hypothetical protein